SPAQGPRPEPRLVACRLRLRYQCEVEREHLPGKEWHSRRISHDSRKTNWPARAGLREDELGAGLRSPQKGITGLTDGADASARRNPRSKPGEKRRVAGKEDRL